MSKKYDYQTWEEKYRPYWRSIDLYKTGTDPEKPNHYILDYFPYPSGAGLSVGHCRNYVPTCIATRFLARTGHNVLHPMGWDAFGLPAENYAIQNGRHPRETTTEHAANYRRQLELTECAYDWDREIDSTDPDYYRWTQWFFKLLFDRGLAYQAFGAQWWCPDCQTILANEQVEAGRCWRCDSLVVKKGMKQWYFRITEYADRLLADLDRIDWPEPIKQMQRNWIGRSEGSRIEFTVADQPLPIFTTRADTLFGVTFIAIAPEHPLVEQITSAAQWPAVQGYVNAARRQSEIDRLSTTRSKDGVDTGATATHPFTGEAIPIWVADYVLLGYGSGAVMGVPAHDDRDLLFAKRYGLPIRKVVERNQPPDQAPESNSPIPERWDEAFTAYGVLVASGAFSGLASSEAIEAINEALAANGTGKAEVSYKMRDWLISRQRYWGAPIPIIHCARCGAVAVPEDQLPVTLPEIEDFAPAGNGRSPLAKVSDWVNTTCPNCGGPGERETDTMDGFACSSWYFLRFPNPHYQTGPFDPEAVKRWLPVDTYVGGAEHAVMHLLYARFWTKVLSDAGHINFDEPFSVLRNQGVLHAPSGQRMSKSRGNVITPDSVIAVHGTDALRSYVVFMGPFEGNVTWSEQDIRGTIRFLERFWQLAVNVTGTTATTGDEAAERQMIKRMHQVIAAYSEDMTRYKYNTAVAKLMGWLNELAAIESAIRLAIWQEVISTFAQLLSPIAPFVTEAVWQELLGHVDSIHTQPWLSHDPDLAAVDEVTIVVQINGKVRGKVVVPAGLPKDEAERIALANAAIAQRLDGITIRRTVVVPDKLVNIVTG